MKILEQSLLSSSEKVSDWFRAIKIGISAQSINRAASDQELDSCQQNQSKNGYTHIGKSDWLPHSKHQKSTISESYIYQFLVEIA